MSRPFTFLPQGYKKQIHWRTKAGIAKTGQVDKQGWVKQGEHWDGSLDGAVGDIAPVKVGLEKWLLERGWKYDVIDGLIIPRDSPPEVRKLLLPGRGH